MKMNRSQAELSDTCDKAIAILKKTNDGNLLDPQDLKLTELAVTGFLSDEGREKFATLHQHVVVDETYQRPFLHDIEHITRDHAGYIYYKGIYVEHYTPRYIYTEKGKKDLMKLKRRCESLERKGVEVSFNAVMGLVNQQ